jgi:hypothetical protein
MCSFVETKIKNMGHTISSVNGSYHENPVNNVANHHNENQSTTNHIYLHPGHHSGEFENWMRKIGGLLQIDKEYSQLKPLLDMIIALLEPSRLFLIPHPSIERFDIKTTIEILLVLNHRQDSNHEKLVERILNVACMKISSVVLNIFSEDEWDSETEDEHFYYSAHCRSKFLVFSGSPYRIQELDQPDIKRVQEVITNRFQDQVIKSKAMLAQIEGLYNEQISSDLLYGIASACIKQFYRMVAMPFLLDLPVLNRSHKKLRKMATRITPQAESLPEKNIELYSIWDNEELDEEIKRDVYLPSFADLQKYFEILKTAFEQKLATLFDNE